MAKKKDVSRDPNQVEPNKVKAGKTSAPPKRIMKKVVEDGAKSVSEYLGGVNKRIVIKSWEKAGRNSARWWLEPDERLYAAIDNSVTTIESAQSTRRLNTIKFARLYGNYEALSFPYAVNRGAGGQDSSNRVTLNIIQSVIDAVSAKIAKDQPKVSFVTTGANDYFLKLRANNLTKYMSGLFKQAEVYQNAELVFRDACVLGTGYIKVLEDQGQIKTEWCAMDEIRVDELDGLKQKPRSMHQIKLISRDMLCYQFPEKAEQIKSAQSAIMGKIALESTVDMMRVIESWHLPSTKESKDGLHAITIENCTLFSEDYVKEYFPIVPFRWMNKPLGYFGRSITEEILSIQIEINKILRTIQQSQELAAVPIIFVPNGSEIPEDVLLSNTIARMVPFSGNQPPMFVVPTAQNPEVYQHLNSFIQWAYQIVGLAQTSAAGMKPAGVDSAVAIREVSDIETGRFAQVALRWEQFFVDLARVAVDMSKDLYTKNTDLKVSVSEKKILKEISWKDVDITDNPFDIQTFPTSQLPDTPAGRIQTITEYIQNQWISKERGMELLNLDPDLEGEVNQQTASLRLTEKWLSEMVEDGIMHKPEAYMNLQLAQSVSIGVYNQLLIDNCPEDRLDLVRQFIMDVSDLLNPPAPPEMPMAPGAMDPNMMPPGPEQQFMPGTGAGNAPMAASNVPMMQTV